MNLNAQKDLISDKEKEILRALRSIRYGSVEITIHDSRVVQIDCTEKIRFEKNIFQGGAGI